jgi:hypothetical protein
MQRLGELNCITLATDVHEQDVRVEIIQVMMQGRDLNPAFFELADERVDFVPGQYEVAHHDRVLTGSLEGEPGAECKGGLYLHVIGCNL